MLQRGFLAVEFILMKLRMWKRSHFPDVSSRLYLKFTKVMRVGVSYFITSYYFPVNCVLREINFLENKTKNYPHM